LADYRDHYDEIRASGADVVAVSVDPPEASEAVRRDLPLPFTILCDTERRVAQEWDVYNPRERGGIAKPALFIIDPGRTVRYAHGRIALVRCLDQPVSALGVAPDRERVAEVKI